MILDLFVNTAANILAGVLLYYIYKKLSLVF